MPVSAILKKLDEVILDKSIVPPSGDLGRIPNFENIKSIKPNAAIDFKKFSITQH